MSTAERQSYAWNRRKLRLALTFALIPFAALAAVRIVQTVPKLAQWLGEK